MINLIWNKETKAGLNTINSESGVYVISILFSDGNYHAVNVGASLDIKEKLEQVFSGKEENASLKSFLGTNYDFKISFAYVQKEEIENIKNYLIFRLNPFFNEKNEKNENNYSCNLPNVEPF